MQLNQLRLQNFCGFDELTVQLDAGMNVIAGINGAGKTSLLRAVEAAASCFFSERTSFSVPSKRIDSRCVRQAKLKYKNGYRFEDQFPCVVEGQFSDEKGKSTVIISIGNALEKEHPKCRSENRPAATDDPLPIFACYWTDRSWKAAGAVSQVSAALSKETRAQGYESAANASANPQKFIEWLVAKTLERLQAAELEEWSEADSRTDELGLLNRALMQALPGEFKSIKFDFREKSVLVAFADGKEGERTVPFERLSDGERVFISLLADIVRRACLLNPQLGDQVLAEASGLVLVDELELHLHPAWQRRIVKALASVFPKVQFIVTTHSPQILGEVEHGKVLLLSNGKISAPAQSFGLTSDEILKYLMGAENVNSSISQSLEQAYILIDDQRFDEAREKIKEIQARTKGAIEETVNLESLINTLEAQAEEE